MSEAIIVVETLNVPAFRRMFPASSPAARDGSAAWERLDVAA